MKINILCLERKNSWVECSCSLSVSECIHSKIKCVSLYISSVYCTVVLTQTRYKTIRLYGYLNTGGCFAKSVMMVCFCLVFLIDKCFCRSSLHVIFFASCFITVYTINVYFLIKVFNNDSCVFQHAILPAHHLSHWHFCPLTRNSTSTQDTNPHSVPTILS